MQIHFIHDTLTFLSSPSLQNDHDSLFAQQIANPPYCLSLPLDTLLAPSRKSPAHQPRPQNSFLLFRKDYNERIHLLNCNETNKLSAKMISKNAKLEWNQQSAIVKNFFKVLAKEADKRHKQMFPNYKYQPKSKPKCNDNKDENESTSTNSELFEDTTVVENVSTFDINGSIASDVDITELEKYFDIQLYYSDQK
ncbi:11201_t:CDS:1 [Cetraspora pellucida]|uniref:11201_t:CDS:1 n=1 Tax=Cetraspora pellucida TaxID=1433469 RepID=A0ACA9KQB0_9GLOM|nr:11201_t:CDS:1 [Cetraspora pellucida]